TRICVFSDSCGSREAVSSPAAGVASAASPSGVSSSFKAEVSSPPAVSFSVCPPPAAVCSSRSFPSNSSRREISFLPAASAIPATARIPTAKHQKTYPPPKNPFLSILQYMDFQKNHTRCHQQRKRV